MIYPKSIPDQSSFWWSGLIFMLSLFLMLSHSTRLAAQAGTINFGRAYTITSSILQEQRQLMVYTPPDYADSKDSCHVLYLLDAEWNFHFVASTVDKLMASGMMPPSIVVGIVNTNRSRDLTPAGNNDNPRRFGGAASFLSFITEELQPWVGEHFRTYPFNILAGHSFGGLFTVFSMMEAPEAFQAYIALSPSLGRNSEQQVKRAASFFEAKDPLSKSLYLAIGDEQGYTKLSTEKLDQVVQGSKPMSFRYKFDMLEDENHASITSIGFLKGLRYMYQGYNIEDIGAIDEIFIAESYLKDLSARFGHRVKMPEAIFQRFVKEQIAERELDYALFILGKYESAYPNSYYPQLHKADIKLLQGDFLEAKKLYQSLKEKGLENDNLDRILKNLEDE